MVEDRNGGAIPRRNAVAGSGTLARVRQAANAFSGKSQKLARFILEDPHRVAYLTITDLARRSGVSQSAIVRFAKALGFKGYPEFRIALAQDVVDYGSLDLDEIGEEDDVRTVAQRVAAANIQVIEDTLELLDSAALARAAEAISRAGRVSIHAAGPTYAVAWEAFSRFSRLGLSVVSHQELHTQMTSASQLGPGDVAIGISYGGYSIGTVEPLRAAREQGATTICITRLARNPLTTVSDIVLHAATMDSARTSRRRASRTSMNFLVEVLFVLVAADPSVSGDDGPHRSRAAIDRLRQAAFHLPAEE